MTWVWSSLNGSYLQSVPNLHLQVFKSFKNFLYSEVFFFLSYPLLFFLYIYLYFFLYLLFLHSFVNQFPFLHPAIFSPASLPFLIYTSINFIQDPTYSNDSHYNYKNKNYIKGNTENKEYLIHLTYQSPIQKNRQKKINSFFRLAHRSVNLLILKNIDFF